MPPEDPSLPELVSADEAARRLEKASSTVRCWAIRFNARKIGRQGRKVYYDMRDLRVIEREINHGHDVPPTPEERAAIAFRCPLQPVEQTFRAA